MTRTAEEPAMPNHAKAIEAARNAYSGVAGEQPCGDGLTAAITAFLRNVEPSEAMGKAGLHAPVPGGSDVWVWLPQKDAWTPGQSSGQVLGCAFKAMSDTLANEVEQG